MNGIMRKLMKITRITKQYRNSMTEGTEINGMDSQYLMNVYYHQGMTQEQLASHLCIDKSNVTRKLTSLEERGYIERIPMPADKRNLQLYITQKTADIMPFIRHFNNNWDKYILSALTEEEKEFLDAVLTKIKEKAEAWQGFDFSVYDKPEEE